MTANGIKTKYFNACPVCGFVSLKKTFTKKHFKSSFAKCLKCGLIMQNPQENPVRTMDRYKDDYFNYELANQHIFFNLIKMTLDEFNILKTIPPGSDILEIGSATGLFLKYMNENGHNAAGLEICERSADYGIQNFKVNIIKKRLEETDFKDGSFDFIHFSHLIEHINDPVNFICKVRTLLKSGGYALITTPNASGLFAGIYSEDWRCIVDDHLFLFGIRNLKILFKKAGFKIIKIKTWGSIPKGKTIPLIKSITDHLVKASMTGDVAAFLIQKSHC